MLKFPDGIPVTTLAHLEEYKAAQKRLTPEEQKQLTDELLKLIRSGTYHNSSVLGAKNLNNPMLFAPLLKAADGKSGDVGMFFGLFLYATFMDLNEEWIVQSCNPEGRLDAAGHDYYQRKEDLKKKYLHSS